jgi:hypothetical protein
MVQVGQILYGVKDMDIEEYEVFAVGRKYFYVKSLTFRDSKKGFDKTTLKYADKESSQFNKQLYISKAVLESLILRSKNISFLKNFSSTWGKSWDKLSDEDLETVVNIVKKDSNENI